MSRLPRIAANISTLFRELPLLDRFEAAAAHGFDGVEIQFPYGESPAVLAKAAEAAKLPVILINAPIVPSVHPYGIAGRPELAGLFRSQLAQLEDYAAALRPRFVHVLAGHPAAQAGIEGCLRAYEDNLDLAAGRLAPLGIGVLIEPLNSVDVPGYLLGSFDLARSILARHAPAVGLQFDAYHAARMGLDPAQELLLHLPHLRHVQFADAPGRHQPGTGGVRFRQLLATLLGAGYGGWLGAEYSPSGPTDQSLRWLSEWREWMRAHAEAPPQAPQDGGAVQPACGAPPGSTSCKPCA